VNNTSESWLSFLEVYENVVERIVEFCYTPRTIREIVQEFNYVEDVIKFVFRQLVEHGVLEIIGKNNDGLDVFKGTRPPSTISRGVSIEESIEQRPQSRYWNKILVLGDSGVGKTTLLLRFVDKGKDHDTIGFVFHAHRMTFEYENQTYFVVIWESTGKVWKQFWKRHYENAGGVFFIFDTTNPKTLESIDHWADVLPSPEERIPLVIVENKIDLGSQIPQSLIDSYVEKYGADHIRVSAKDDDNPLEEVFNRMILNNLKKAAGNSQKQDSSQT